jgi:hypothetical protein
MHIFQNIKTYDKPRNKDRLNEQKEPKKEPDSWFDAFKGCLFAIFLFVGSIALLYGIGSAVDSSEFGKDVLLIVGGIFVVGLVAFYLGTPASAGNSLIDAVSNSWQLLEEQVLQKIKFLPNDCENDCLLEKNA